MGVYQLSKITNDSARGERRNVTLEVNKRGIESKHNWQPWPLVLPPFIGSQCGYCRGYHSHHAQCTQSVCHVLYSLCPPSASPTVPTMPAVPTPVPCAPCSEYSYAQNPSRSPFLLYLVSLIPAICLLYSPYPSVYSEHLSHQTLPVLLAIPKLSRSPCSLYLLCMLCGTPAQEASPLGLQTEGMCLPGD